MIKSFTKILLLFLIVLIIYACNTTKRVKEGNYLLTKADVILEDKKEKNEEVVNLMLQKPNTSFFISSIPLKLHMHNLAKVNADSSYQAWLLKKPNRYDRLSKLLSEKQVARLGESFLVSGFSDFLKKNGEAPVILDTAKVIRSAAKYKAYYFNKGYFNTTVDYKIDSIGNKKAAVSYIIHKKEPFYIDSVGYNPSTKDIDSLYNISKFNSNLIKGKQYNSQDLASERFRISSFFRNNGAYKFQENYIRFDIDTTIAKQKANVQVIIDEFSRKSGDSIVKEPFKLYKISQVNIFTDNAGQKEYAADSVTYNNFNLYSSAKLNYKPKAITDAIFITKGSTYSDVRRSITNQSISNLRVFNYPRIEYVEDPNDSTKSSLISNVYLVPIKKYTLFTSADVIHSNIQDFGILGSAGLRINNLFKGAEILEIAGKANIGSSKELANPDDVFFNLTEFGADVKLSFPRIFFPLNTDKIIPKIMFPTTQITLGASRQKNIGLDKESFNAILNYSWKPKRYNNFKFDLINIQYINNLNPSNYFIVYKSTYNRLNDIASINRNLVNNTYFNPDGNLNTNTGTINFINDVVNRNINLTDEENTAVRSIGERRNRLTENNLIFSANITYQKSSKQNLQDLVFSSFRTKLESAGAFLSLLDNNKKNNEFGNSTFFNVAYSQYIKGELEYIKHWKLGNTKYLSTKLFGGLAVPYGNSNSIPFIRSYYSGGTNDNRAWQAYSLGPGSSGGINDFNEANMKLAFSLEYRFNVAGKLNGALFTDIGNIWNVFDNVEDPKSKFSGIKSLKDTAIGTGIGARYDFNFFIFRLDLGFKTHNPAYLPNQRWFRDYNFGRSVLNIGINYPF